MIRAVCVYQDQDETVGTLTFVFASSKETVMPVYELANLVPDVQGKLPPTDLYGGSIFRVAVPPETAGRQQAIVALKAITHPMQPYTVQELVIATRTCAKGLHSTMTATAQWLDGFELPNPHEFDEKLRSIITPEGIEICLPAVGPPKLKVFEPVVIGRLGQFGVYVHKLHVNPTKCCMI